MYDYGVRPMKVYPLNEGELSGLFWISTFSTSCFSFGGGFWGFAISTKLSLDLSTGIKSEMITYWTAWEQFAFWLGGVLIFIGFVLMIFRESKIFSIKEKTTFNHKYPPTILMVLKREAKKRFFEWLKISDESQKSN